MVSGAACRFVSPRRFARALVASVFVALLPPAFVSGFSADALASRGAAQKRRVSKGTSLLAPKPVRPYSTRRSLSTYSEGLHKALTRVRSGLDLENVALDAFVTGVGRARIFGRGVGIWEPSTEFQRSREAVQFLLSRDAVTDSLRTLEAAPFSSGPPPSRPTGAVERAAYVRVSLHMY